jgi:hypothetical protein
MAIRYRVAAHQRLVELLGDAAPAAATIPALPIPYILLNGKASYEDADLVAYAESVKAKGIRRMGGRRRQALPAA